jgi:chemotaxis protein histidine kinase CheA
VPPDDLDNLLRALLPGSGKGTMRALKDLIPVAAAYPHIEQAIRLRLSLVDYQWFAKPVYDLRTCAEEAAPLLPSLPLPDRISVLCSEAAVYAAAAEDKRSAEKQQRRQADKQRQEAAKQLEAQLRASKHEASKQLEAQRRAASRLAAGAAAPAVTPAAAAVTPAAAAPAAAAAAAAAEEQRKQRKWHRLEVSARKECERREEVDRLAEEHALAADLAEQAALEEWKTGASERQKQDREREKRRQHNRTQHKWAAALREVRSRWVRHCHVPPNPLVAALLTQPGACLQQATWESSFWQPLTGQQRDDLRRVCVDHMPRSGHRSSDNDARAFFGCLLMYGYSVVVKKHSAVVRFDPPPQQFRHGPIATICLYLSRKHYVPGCCCSGCCPQVSVMDLDDCPLNLAGGMPHKRAGEGDQGEVSRELVHVAIARVRQPSCSAPHPTTTTTPAPAPPPLPPSLSRSDDLVG